MALKVYAHSASAELAQVLAPGAPHSGDQSPGVRQPTFKAIASLTFQVKQQIQNDTTGSPEKPG
jgi:hypothetical protein